MEKTPPAAPATIGRFFPINPEMPLASDLSPPLSVPFVALTLSDRDDVKSVVVPIVGWSKVEDIDIEALVEVGVSDTGDKYNSEELEFSSALVVGRGGLWEFVNTDASKLEEAVALGVVSDSIADISEEL
jgi:hypothetical protein